MFDNLRDSAESSSFYEEEPNELYQEQPAAKAAPKRRSNARFLGMTPQQRFFVALMLFFTICVMGTLALFVFQKMSLF